MSSLVAGLSTFGEQDEDLSALPMETLFPVRLEITLDVRFAV